MSSERTATSSFSRGLINTCEITPIKVMTFIKHSMIKVDKHGRKLTALVTPVQSLRVSISESQLLRCTRGPGRCEGQEAQRAIPIYARAERQLHSRCSR